MNVVYFKQASGKEPVKQYIEKLPINVAANILAILKDIKEYGLEKSLVTCRQIEGKLWEIKIDAHRVFYVILEGPLMVLLHAYKKQSQKAPVKELNVAKKRMRLVFGGSNV